MRETGMSGSFQTVSQEESGEAAGGRVEVAQLTPHAIGCKFKDRLCSSSQEFLTSRPSPSSTLGPDDRGFEKVKRYLESWI